MLNQSIASQFDVFDQGSQCNGGMKLDYPMQMFFDAVDRVEETVIVF